LIFSTGCFICAIDLYFLVLSSHRLYMELEHFVTFIYRTFSMLLIVSMVEIQTYSYEHCFFYIDNRSLTIIYVLRVLYDFYGSFWKPILLPSFFSSLCRYEDNFFFYHLLPCLHSDRIMFSPRKKSRQARINPWNKFKLWEEGTPRSQTRV
jgi:hypothetical protein